MKEDLDTDATAQIETAEKKLFELSNQGESQGGFIDFAEALTSSLGQIEQAYQKDGKISGLPSGLDALDEKPAGSTIPTSLSLPTSGNGQNRSCHQYRL